MTFGETVIELKKSGTAQNIKIYRRHGAKGDLFGVSFAALGKLQKRIGRDQDLARQLWASGNADARTLAAMVADPNQMSAAEADRWIKDIDYYIVADYFSGMVAKCSFAENRMYKWMKSKKEFSRQCGYSMLASRLKNGTEVSDSECKKLLGTIEKEIHASQNRARHAMNNAVIAIGVFRPSLARLAAATAVRIGPVEVDHGDTSCKTPDAVSYIKKSLNRRK